MISFLDNELCRFAMQQAIRHYAPEAEVRYRLFLGDENISFSGIFFEKLDSRIKKISKLKLLKEEAAFLASQKYFSKGYIDWLRGYRFNSSEIIFQQGDKGELILEISLG